MEQDLRRNPWRSERPSCRRRGRAWQRCRPARPCPSPWLSCKRSTSMTMCFFSTGLELFSRRTRSAQQSNMNGMLHCIFGDCHKHSTWAKQSSSASTKVAHEGHWHIRQSCHYQSQNAIGNHKEKRNWRLQIEIRLSM